MKRLIAIAGMMLIVFLSRSFAQCDTTTNVALNKTATASSASTYHDASKAIDGSVNNGSYWQTTYTEIQNDTQNIVVNLGSSYTMCRIDVWWAVENVAKDFTVDVSNDGTNWTNVITVTNNGSSNTINSWTNQSAVGSYIRVKMTKKQNAYSNYGIAEIRVFNQSISNPVILYQKPANNSSFTLGQSIVDSVTAYFSDHVDFYYEQNGTLNQIGSSDFSSPYVVNWTPTQAGTYKLKAKATNTYNTSVWDSVTVIVNPASSSGGWSLTGNSGIDTTANFLGTTDNKAVIFKSNNIKRMSILPDGKVRIGTLGRSESDAALSVDGTIYTKKIKVTQITWADFVFESGYRLPTLVEIEQYIKRHGHLPGIPSAREVSARGVDVGEMQTLLLQKIEELTLLMIEQGKLIRAQQDEIEALKAKENSKK